VATAALEKALTASVRHAIATRALRVYVLDAARAVGIVARTKPLGVAQRGARTVPTPVALASPTVQRARVIAAACVAAAGWPDAQLLGGVARGA
jgi:hypothetical protein